MRLQISFSFFAFAVLLAACDSSSTSNPPADAAIHDLSAPTIDTSPADVSTTIVDASHVSDASIDAAFNKRTLVHNPLFGDTHPQNLFIDPNFSVRMSGIGNWRATTADGSQDRPNYSSSLMSDAPAGIALTVARLADATDSTSNFELALLAQVPGGPGPYRLRVWVSTLDAAASATLPDVMIGILTALDATAIEVSENKTKLKVIAGRTWHLYEGVISQDLTLGGFVELDFAESTNTWLLQAPEFVPMSMAIRVPPPHTLGRSRPMTAREKQLIDHYVHQPRLSVPASHPAFGARSRDRKESSWR